MTEDYLHFIWNAKRFNFLELFTTDNEPLEISRFGVHNAFQSGPDFSNAAIRYNEALVCGPVEIHIRSSDWYKHKHHMDEAYNNVVLHVVFEHDKEVIQNGRVLPTLELKSRVDLDHFRQFDMFQKNKHSIICGKQLLESNPMLLQNMMDKALVQKFHSKIKTVSEYMETESNAMYYFLAAAFGSNLNVYPFLELARSIPIQKLRALHPDHRYNLMLSQSGLASSENSNQYEKWHFKGNRPGNFPTKRLFQFAHSLCDEQLELLSELESPEEIVRVFHQIIEAQASGAKFTAGFRNQILINAVVPYFVFRAQIDQKEVFQEIALNILDQIPPENNNITRKWKQFGLQIENARESQGLLALHRYYCTAKKCLSCEVGEGILKTK